MPRRTKNLTSIDESGYEPDDSMERYVGEKYPDIDMRATWEVFVDKALAGDWVYASWPAAFRNYLRNAGQYGGVVHHPGTDPAWRQLLIEARALQFRKPRYGIETIEQYRQALRAHEPPGQTDLLARSERRSDGPQRIDAAKLLGGLRQ